MSVPLKGNHHAYRLGGKGLLISRLQAVLGAIILIIATAVVSAVVISTWNPFPPKDYEDCGARAATSAKSKDALTLLLSICRSDFVGRRHAGGGYSYYDACQDRDFDIKGPNPTPDEQKYIREQCLAYSKIQAQIESEKIEAETRAERAAQEAASEHKKNILARQVAATPFVKLGTYSYECPLSGDIHTLELFSCKDHVTMKMKVTNGSKEKISRLIIGFASVPTKNDACPVSSTFTRNVWAGYIAPGEADVIKIEDLDSEISKHPLCLKVIDVEISD